MTCRKAIYPVEITEEIWVESNDGTEIIIWTEATDSGDSSLGTGLLCISEKPKSSVQSMERAPKSDPRGRCESSPPLNGVLAPV